MFEAFAARDEDALLEIMTPEIEFFGPTATVLNEGKCYRGHDGIRRYFQDAEPALEPSSRSSPRATARSATTWS